MKPELEQLTLRQKIGQMMLCGFEGAELTEALRGMIRDYQIGGVIYFARNVDNVEQVARLTSDIQQAAHDAGLAPLWVSIDQEGGMVARITDGVALMPGNMAVAAAGSLESAYEASHIAGRELKALGINLNFAPVLDVNNNAENPVIGVRSFGESPESVAEYGAQAVRGLQDAGVVATAKHFPGHGDTDVDSHLDLPTVPHDRERMERIELVPFKRAIAEGVDAIMSAHIYFPALEKRKLPVTLSKTVLTGLLREELGFEGVIMTDCMEMNAISEHYGTVEAAVLAVEAGADLVLISHRMDLQIRAIEALEEAVRSGRISESRIDESVRRLIALKRKRGLFDRAQGAFPEWRTIAGSEAHMEAARRISEASVTLVKDENGLLPLKRERTLVVTIAAAVLTQVDESFDNPHSLGAALAANGLEVVDRVVQPANVGAVYADLLKDAKSDDVRQLVVGTYNAQFSTPQQELVAALVELGKPLVVVALRNPYDLLKLGAISTFAAVYESRPLALQSAAKALLGRIPFQGQLPVSLSESYPRGSGVTKL